MCEVVIQQGADWGEGGDVCTKWRAGRVWGYEINLQLWLKGPTQESVKNKISKGFQDI